MSRAAKVLRTGLFPGMVAVALAFGAAQALAAPQPAAAAAARACTDEYCNDYCVGQGYGFGWCDRVWCRCL